MGTRVGLNKEDFVGGLGFGVVEYSHKDAMLPSHHHYYPSSASFCYCFNGVGDPMFSASSNQSYTASLGDPMFSAISVSDPFSFSSSGEMGRSMSEKGGAAFSEAQWQELERQRNIYKYIMASLPVPSELLTPFSKNTSNTNNQDVTVARGGSLKLGITSNASNKTADMEPWRCKRTDGKKWRCSRTVVPDKRYCERHTLKSRPRSSKHVESSSHHNETRTTKNNTTTYPQFYGQPLSQFSSYDHHHRGSSREVKRGFDYDLNYMEKELLVDQSFGALGGLLSPNQTEHNQETRRLFVKGVQDEAMGSSLTLSMAGGGMEEEAEGRRQHQWISHEGPSWLCSMTPGGPLAEALCLGVSNNASTSTTTTSSCSRSSS